MQLRQGLLSRVLLRILLGATLALANNPALHHNLGGKDFIMLRSGATQELVGDIHVPVPLQKFLQTRLVVRVNTMTAHIIDLRLHHGEQVSLGHGKALVQINGAEHRFEGISQDGGTLPSSAELLALAQKQELA